MDEDDGQPGTTQGENTQNARPPNDTRPTGSAWEKWSVHGKGTHLLNRRRPPVQDKQQVIVISGHREAGGYSASHQRHASFRVPIAGGAAKMTATKTTR